MEIRKEITSKYKYVFDYSFTQEKLNVCRALQNQYGRASLQWNANKWRFNNLDIYTELVKIYPFINLDEEVKRDATLWKYEKEKNKFQEVRAEVLKKATDTDFIVRGIKGELRPYQKIGVEFFINNNGKAILSDDMGSGKSLQALAYIVHTKKKKTLVVCPASVKYSWSQEVNKWTNLCPVVIDTRTESISDLFQAHDVFIINYDLLKKFYSQLEVIRFNTCIMDEFHYIKSTSAIRSKLATGLAKNIPSVILLSGTPMLNRPIELFTALHLMDPAVWNDWFQYSVRYAGGHQSRWGWETTGATNIDELQQKISRYFLRRTKNQILKELPPRQYIDYPVELDKEHAVNYELAEESFVQYLKEIKGKNVTENAQASKLVKLNELRQITSGGKVWAAKELIQDSIDSGQKILVFSVYNKPLEDLYKYFGKEQSVILTGKTVDTARRDIIKRFQEDEKTKIFFGGIKAAGAGITLTAASVVLFLDFSWTPADHLQAADRCHRLGQTAESITIYQLFSKGTIDEDAKHILVSKQKLIDKIIDGKVTDKKTSTGVLDGLIKILENKKLKKKL